MIQQPPRFLSRLIYSCTILFVLACQQSYHTRFVDPHRRFIFVRSLYSTLAVFI